MLAAIKAYDGETLAEKVENYLLSAGVTATQIHNIKAIMLGKDTEEEEKPTYKQGFDFSEGDIIFAGGRREYRIGTAISSSRYGAPKTVTSTRGI